MAFSPANTKFVNSATTAKTERDLPLDESVVSQLSKRQLEVLIGAIKGKPNKIIAHELDITEGNRKGSFVHRL